MPTIKFIEHDGTEHDVEADVDFSVMNAAINNLVPGIDADCGGECSCATCHVMVAEEWLGKIDDPSDQEGSMLDLNPDRQTNSRLSCQINVTDELDGLVVQLPEFQY